MKKTAFSLELSNERSTMACGEQLGMAVNHGLVIYASGELGVGKTTFVRGFLHGKGYFGKVCSPSYTLIESYKVQGMVINHLDLYRIEKAEELEDIGIRDYMLEDSIWIIEWPEKGRGHLPVADISVLIEYTDSGRLLHFSANSVEGQVILDNCQEKNRFSSFHA